jgi:hypothetical protein
MGLRDIDQNAALTDVAAVLEERRHQVICHCGLVSTSRRGISTSRRGMLHQLVYRKRVGHMPDPVKTELNTRRLPFFGQVLQYWLNIGGAAKAFRQVDIERQTAHFVGTLHGLKGLIEVPLANKTERAHEIRNHLDMQGSRDGYAVATADDVGKCFAHVLDPPGIRPLIRPEYLISTVARRA